MILVQRTEPVALPGQEERVRRCGRDDFYVGICTTKTGIFLEYPETDDGTGQRIRLLQSPKFLRLPSRLRRDEHRQ